MSAFCKDDKALFAKEPVNSCSEPCFPFKCSPYHSFLHDVSLFPYELHPARNSLSGSAVWNVSNLTYIRCPVINSSSISPAAYTSKLEGFVQLKPGFGPLSSNHSGAAYSLVATMSSLWQFVLLLSTTLPKSINLTKILPLHFLIATFSGFKSWCTYPALCKKSRPSIICLK